MKAIISDISKFCNYIAYYGFTRALHKVYSTIKKRVKIRKFIKTSLPEKEILELQKKSCFIKAPLISIITPLYNTPIQYLRDMIDSVCNQSYENWQLCLADGSDTINHVEEEVNRYCIKCPGKIKYIKLKKNKGISENTNECIRLADGDYLAVLDHDDILAPNALFEVVKAINEKDADVIYTDEAIFRTKVGKVVAVHLKPDFAIDNLRANNYICHLLVFRKRILDKVGMYRKECDGSQDHDMILRISEISKNIVHIPKVLYFWRAHNYSVAGDINSKKYASEAGIKAVSDHLSRQGIRAEVKSSKDYPVIYKVDYDLIEQAMISIIIPNSNSLSDLKNCIDSIFVKSSYSNYEIIIVHYNSCLNTDVNDYYKEVEKRGNVHVLNYRGKSINYYSVCNFGASHANGKYILLLHSDTKVISPNWIEEMLMFSQRVDVGVVGAKLYYANDTIQHAGICLNPDGENLFEYLYKGEMRSEMGYMGKLIYVQNLTAVSAACLMIKKSTFDIYGGFDEELGDEDYSIVDFCLRLRNMDLLTVFTPYAELYHYEKNNKRIISSNHNHQYVRFKKRWKAVLEKGDPYYKSNLIQIYY